MNEPVTESNIVIKSPLLGSPTGELVLRVGGDQGRLVRTDAIKCTIGAAPDCTIQLFDEDVQAVHCLVLRGERETVVRRWAEDARLNDEEFTDASLREGDRLDIGSVRLEVLRDGASADDAFHGDARPEASVANPTRLLSKQLRPQRTSFSPFPPHEVRRIGHQRVRRLLKELRDNQGQLRQLHGKLEKQEEKLALVDDQQEAELALARQSMQLQEQTEQLKRERESLVLERESWHQMQSSYESESAKRIKELTDRVGQLEAVCQELRIEKRRVEDDFQRQLAETRKVSPPVDVELSTSYRANAKKEADERAGKACHDDVPATDSLESDVPKDDEFDTSSRGATTGESSNMKDVEEIRYEQPSEESPLNTLDILQRLGQESPLDDEPPCTPNFDRADRTADASADEVATDAVCSTDAAADPDGELEEELSVEDYMNRLLGRTRGQSTSSIAYVHKPAEAVLLRSDKSSSSVKSQVVSPSIESEDEYVPRTLPPELTSNLAAMRELANRSARSAIGRHVRTRWGHAAMGKFTVAFVAAISSSILWVWSAGYSSWTFLAACIAAIVAIFWALQTGILLKQFLIGLRMKEQNQPDREEAAVGTEPTPASREESSAAEASGGAASNPDAEAKDGFVVSVAMDNDSDVSHVVSAR